MCCHLEANLEDCTSVTGFYNGHHSHSSDKLSTQAQRETSPRRPDSDYVNLSSEWRAQASEKRF